VKNKSVQSEPCGKGVTRKILGRGSKLMMVEVKFKGGAIGELHSHPHEQVSYIANGSFEFNLNENKQVMKKGDSIYIPSNKPHSVLALEEGSIIVDIFTPQREDFLK
jgi:quercetin dioxygenase-like cupin family protein